MTLLIDVGNSRIKCGRYQNSELEDLIARPYQRQTFAEELGVEFGRIKTPPADILVANVAGDEIAKLMIDSIRELWSISPVFVQVEQQRCGVLNGYKNISELGIDRWLAMLAVWSQYHKAACIVDCGTALTIDVINNKGEHQGGFIIPGPRLMQDSLVNKTGDIVAPVSEQYMKSLGLSTIECITHGAGSAASSFIDSVTFDMKQQYGDDLCCVITGGTANELLDLLENTFIHDAYLVLKGLARLVEDKS